MSHHHHRGRAHARARQIAMQPGRNRIAPHVINVVHEPCMWVQLATNPN